MLGEILRDPRSATFLRAHIRSDRGWSEAIVCNISAHGMMLRGDDLPARGSFIEISTGKGSVAGQVRWSLAGRCGIRTREVVNLAALLGSQAGPEPHAAPSGAVIRHRAPNPEERAARGRSTGRLLDLALSVALLAAGAWLLATAITGLFGTPLQRISSQLAPSRPGT